MTVLFSLIFQKQRHQSSVMLKQISWKTAHIHLLPYEQYVLMNESSCIDDEKVLYERSIKEYYIERYVVNERELK